MPGTNDLILLECPRAYCDARQFVPRLKSDPREAVKLQTECGECGVFLLAQNSGTSFKYIDKDGKVIEQGF